MNLKVIAFLVALLCIFSDSTFAYESPEAQPVSNKYINIVYPVRSRELWFDQSVENFEKIKNLTASKNLKATWLLQYDVLSDETLLSKIQTIDTNNEIGAFLEVSEKLATDSKVAYKLGDGDYYRTDKVLLSGYSPKDREKLINTYFQKYKEIFNNKPVSVGSWYIDSRSQEVLAKQGVLSAITVADQYDTDGASIWGKYYGMPYYPSKYNSLEPASNLEAKIPIVNTQWAQRDLVEGFGRDVFDSRQSFQANDYINNGFGHKYFNNLLDQYLNQETDFMQINIGLEVGQESIKFYEELSKQLSEVSELTKENKIKTSTAGEFAKYYSSNYKDLSPSHLLKKNNNFWFMSPDLRVGFFEENNSLILKDLRFYNGTPSMDYLYKDNSPYLNRRTNAQIDKVGENSQYTLDSNKISDLVTTDRTISFSSGGEKIMIDKRGFWVNDNLLLVNNYKTQEINQREIKKRAKLLDIQEKILAPTSVILFSSVEGEKMFGVGIGNAVLGFHGIKPGLYEFPFQTYARFSSLRDKLIRATGD